MTANRINTQLCRRDGAHVYFLVYTRNKALERLRDRSKIFRFLTPAGLGGSEGRAREEDAIMKLCKTKSTQIWVEKRVKNCFFKEEGSEMTFWPEKIGIGIQSNGS